MKKSMITMFGVALASVAFAQGPVCEGMKCGPMPQCPREGRGCGPQPVVLFVTEQTDDAAIEAYKQAVLAQIDEAVAKSRAPMPEVKKCGCEKCECEQCACEKKACRRPPLKLEFSASCRPQCFKGGRPRFGKGERRRFGRGERPNFDKGECPNFGNCERPRCERGEGCKGPECKGPAPCQGEGCAMPPPAPETEEAAPEVEL